MNDPTNIGKFPFLEKKPGAEYRPSPAAASAARPSVIQFNSGLRHPASSSAADQCDQLLRSESDLLRQQGEVLMKTGEMMNKHAEMIDVYMESIKRKNTPRNNSCRVHVCAVGLTKVLDFNVCT